jgi:hypothetical protein
MSGEETSDSIWMQNAGSWNPAREDQGEPIPLRGALTASAYKEPPQSPQALPEGTQPVEISRDRVVAVITGHNLAKPCTDFGDRLMHTEAYGAPAYTANLRVPLTEAKTLLNGAKVLAMTLGTDGRTDELLSSVAAVRL